MIRPAHRVRDRIELALVLRVSNYLCRIVRYRLIEALLLQLVMLHYLIGTDMFHTLLLQDILANLFEALIDSSIILYLKSTIYRVSYA